MNQDLINEGIDARFLVRGRMQILHVLNDLIHRCEPVSVYTDGSDTAIVVQLLEAREQLLIFQAQTENPASPALHRASRCLFIAYPDGIRVQFAAGPVHSVAWDERSALALALPQELTRLQRQESLRIVIPAHAALHVQLFSGDGTSLGHWPLHDLSVGGLGVSVTQETQHSLGPAIARIGLHLPQFGAIDCAVELRHVSGLAQEQSLPLGRIGLGFRDLPEAMRTALQRYVIAIEHARHNLTDDADATDN